MTGSYKLDELAHAAGVTARTVRYYVQRGLLPPPVFRGKDTAYSEQHLLRLRAIRALQERFLPLDAIQVTLEGLDEAGLAAVLDASPVEQAAPPSPQVEAIRLWRRFSLAEGVELHVSTDAPAESARLAEELLSLAMTRAHTYTKG